jgi:hypothetical protein
MLGTISATISWCLVPQHAGPRRCCPQRKASSRTGPNTQREGEVARLTTQRILRQLVPRS